MFSRDIEAVANSSRPAAFERFAGRLLEKSTAMKPMPLGARYQGQVTAGPGDLASALGNVGVDVVSSPAIIGHLEMACHRAIDPFLDNGEASVGVGFSLQHVAAAFPDRPMDVAAELIAQDGKRFTFRRAGATGRPEVMTGEHERALVHSTAS
jgi:predicted thioesterase